jgi:hypothetical protein
MIRALWRAVRARRRLARWEAVRCTHCGLRRGDADLAVCEGPSLTVLGHPGMPDPHYWADRVRS